MNDFRVVQVEVIDNKEKVIRGTTLSYLKEVLNKKYLQSKDDTILYEMIGWVKSEHPELLL